MKQKGFTLIELLAVIVVIAVIALIAIPIITSVIDKAKLGALKDSAYGILDSAEMYLTKNIGEDLKENVEIIISNGEQISDKKLDYKGKINNGYITIVPTGKIMLCIDNGKNYAKKTLNDKNIIIEDGVCTGEVDPETEEYLTTSSYKYGELRVNIKVVDSSDNLPSNPRKNDVAIISNVDNNGKYMISSSEPSNPVNNIIWIKPNTDSQVAIQSDFSSISVGDCYQYIDNKWVEKVAYLYDGSDWKLFVSNVAWKTWLSLGDLNSTEYTNLSDFTANSELVSSIINNSESNEFLINNPELITELKNDSNYSSVLVPLFLDSTVLTNDQKYQYGLPCYLYTPNNTYNSITGGWQQGYKLNGGTGSITSSYMYVNLPNQNSLHTVYYFRTVNKLNLSKHKSLSANVYQPTFSYGGGGIGTYIAINSSYGTTVPTGGTSTAFGKLTTITKVSLDIEKFNKQELYATYGAYAGGSGNDYSTSYMYQMWLE